MKNRCKVSGYFIKIRCQNPLLQWGDVDTALLYQTQVLCKKVIYLT